MNQTFYNQLKNLPVLNKNEFEFHFKNYKNGNQTSKEILISSNLKLAVHFAKIYENVNPTIELDDLISEATIGLIKAIELYDLSKETLFSFYASFWIKKSIFDFLTSLNFIKHKSSYTNQIEAEIKRLEDEFQTSITDTSLEFYTSFTPTQINNYFNKPTLTDVNVDILDEQEEIDDIKFYIKYLNPEEKNVIQMFYGIDTEKLAYKDIAKKMNVSIQWIYQIRNKALHKLKKEYEKKI